MATLADLRTMLSELVSYDLDLAYGESPSTGQLTALLNWSIRSIARRLYLYEPRITLTTATGINRYDISDATSFERKLLDIDRVTINGTILRNERGRMGLYSSLAEFEAKNPLWKTASNGTPTGAILLGQVLTFDKPASGVIGSTYVSARFIPNDLSSDGSSPLLPTELHEMVAHLGAVKYSIPTATEDEQWNRLKALDARSVELLPELFVRQYQSVHGRSPSVVPGAQGVAS